MATILIIQVLITQVHTIQVVPLPRLARAAQLVQTLAPRPIQVQAIRLDPIILVTPVVQVFQVGSIPIQTP